MRENLVLTSACARTYAHPSVQTLEDGEGSPKATRLEEENVIFSWWEIMRCFWVTSAAKRLFDSVEVSNVRKYQISIDGKENVQKNTQMSFGC